MKIRYLFIGFAAAFFASGPAAAQADLRANEPFFREKVQDFQDWLAVYQLDRLFRVTGVEVAADRVTLQLGPVFTDPACDSLNAAWAYLKQAFWNERQAHIHEVLFEKFLFQFELPPDSAEVQISCRDTAQFHLRIYRQDGQILLDEHALRPMGMGQFTIRLDSLRTLKAGGKLRKLERRDLQAVTGKVEEFFRRHYQGKGFWLRYASVRVTSFYNELFFEVTDLKNEAIRDGYFEYHYARVNVAQSGDQVLVNWKFQGKYGSGIFFPPRQPKDYKDMELHYKDELDSYEYVLFRQLEEFLRRP